MVNGSPEALVHRPTMTPNATTLTTLPRTLGTNSSQSSHNSSSRPPPLPAFTLPPLPKPPIFDAPFNPYVGGAAGAPGGAADALFAGLNDTERAEMQAALVHRIIAAAEAKAFEIQMLVIAGYVAVLLLSLVLVLRIRHHRHQALKGDPEAIGKILLPAFEPLLWLLTALTGVYVVIYAATIRAAFFTIRSTLVTIEIQYALKQVLYLLVPVVLTQKSLAGAALQRGFGLTLLLAAYSVPVCWLMEHYGRAEDARRHYWLLFATRWLVLVPFAYAAAWPPARASPRAIREYGLFLLVMQGLYFAASESFRQGSVEAATTVGWISQLFAGCCPVVIWRVLKADTEHWRGIGQRAVELQLRFRRRGRVEERISARGLHVLIEMHRRYIIDFAHLDLREQIGEGASAVVFHGHLLHHGTTTTTGSASRGPRGRRPVAIKVYTPTTLTEETVAEFSHEAALCGALRHPNVLPFFGMCVCPPTIAFVHELCQGSLRDMTRAMARRYGQHPRRRQRLINLGYMLDAARAVAYLHSFSPPFVHRGIEPSNLLVDNNGVVKLTDFGASRALGSRAGGTSASSSGGAAVAPQRPSTAAAASLLSSSTRRGRSWPWARTERVPPPPTVLAASMDGATTVTRGQRSTVKCNPEYVAPELLRGRAGTTAPATSASRDENYYTEAADVFALGMTMWDILYPGEDKYPAATPRLASSLSSDDGDANAHASALLEQICAGRRPRLDDGLDPPLRELLQSAWHGDPRRRPSARVLVGILEGIQEETASTFALELMEKMERQSATTRATRTTTTMTGRPTRRPRRTEAAASSMTFAGVCAVDAMLDQGHVRTEAEAVRLGNMLMDGRFVHHIKHARAFENSTALYVFDEEQIQLSQPLAMLEEDDADGTRTPEHHHLMVLRRTMETRLDKPSRRGPRHSHSHSALSAHSGISGSPQQRDSVATASGAGSHAVLEIGQGMICPCRKLAQRLQTAQTTRQQLRLKFNPGRTESRVTADLLAREPMGDGFSALEDSETRRPPGAPRGA